MGEIIADMDAKGIFAKNLRAAMDYRGVSAGEIHRKTGQWADPGVAQSTVGRIVAGKQAPDLDTISLICRALDSARGKCSSKLSIRQIPRLFLGLRRKKPRFTTSCARSLAARSSPTKKICAQPCENA